MNRAKLAAGAGVKGERFWINPRSNVGQAIIRDQAPQIEKVFFPVGEDMVGLHQGLTVQDNIPAGF